MFRRTFRYFLPCGKQSLIFRHCIRLSAALLTGIMATLSYAADPVQLDLITEEFPPLQIETDNQPKGYVIDFIKALVEEAAKQQPMVIRSTHFAPWRRAIKMSQDGPNKLFFSISRNQQRESQYHWIGPVSPYEVIIYRHKDGPDHMPESLEELKKYRVAVQGGGSLDTYFTEQGFTPVRVNYTRQTIKMLRALHIDYAPQVNSFPYRIDEFGLNADDFIPVLRVDDLSKQLWLAASPETSPKVVQALQTAYIKLSEINLLDDLISLYGFNSPVMLDYRLRKRLINKI
ncbi:substrate-binding periplasmic protein [Aliamphritea spongicola]|uniref:substrate-binding periplasmic protein n=1 Tax=Aliamphritea spongicola TaxID=707589 RepID=UPI00196AE27C|nr:transporter substrate-binding domain-containing protein [Aliamphritea spongicola]MBN3561448.1 transporter substrate-binding domain-containing protein [Aliamphritea spongicola]